MADIMECIICQDDNSEPLHDNNACTCKYKVHNSCWIEYVHSKSKAACLICRKEHIPPETVQEQDNTYHDIVITINQQNLEHASIPPTYLKAIYAIGTCILLSIIIVIFIWTWS